MESPTVVPAYRQTAVNTLAVVGFISLIGLGVYGAIYSSRYVPNIVGNIGAAAVSFSDVFSSDDSSDLSVIPTPATPTIINFGDSAATTPELPSETASSTSSSTPTSSRPATTPTTPAITTPVFVPTQPHGLADLTVELVAVGYLNTRSTDSFVASQTVPDDKLPAVKFAIANKGTNWSGVWRFDASIPSRPSFTYTSDTQTSLAPGASIEYVLGYDRARSGEQQPLTLTVNENRAALESNYENNTAEFKLNID